MHVSSFAPGSERAPSVCSIRVVETDAQVTRAPLPETGAAAFLAEPLHETFGATVDRSVALIREFRASTGTAPPPVFRSVEHC